MKPLVLEPEFFVDYDGLVHNGPIVIENGHITQLGGTVTAHNAERLSLKNQCILPGFVNSHSHVFQRALRGLTEKKNASCDHFFSWRQKMYQLVNSLDPDEFYNLACLTYMEMLEAGFTHVGEFHYVHHDQQGQPYKNPLALSEIVVKAAAQAGINVCLLECAYVRSDFKKPLEKHQTRFGHTDINGFLSFLREAHKSLTNNSVSIGAAIHSVRAVPEDWFLPIHDLAQSLQMPVHIHASEITKDVTSCLSHTGLTPIGLLEKNQLLSPATTLIHATHLTDSDTTALLKHKPIICLCPSTEKNLGDGFIQVSKLFNQNIRFCLGTDQHVRLDPFAEALSLEYQERLRLQQRNILGKPGNYLYQTLFPCLNRDGMRSLYPTCSDSLLHHPANLVVLALPKEYEWHGPYVALNTILLSSHTSAITHVMSNGHMVVHEKTHINHEKDLIKNNLKSFFKKIDLS